VYVCLYRVIQELLFNVVKHSGVRQATVDVNKQAGDFIRISVSDRGRGFSLAELAASDKGGDGFGLFSIRERVEGLCGRMEIVSAFGQGTTVTITVPLGVVA
jgi:signal transduction histidine kinase